MATRCARRLSARSPAPLPKNVRGGIGGFDVPRLKSSLAFDPCAGMVAQHPKRWVLGESLGVVGILVACQAAVDGLAEEVRQWELAVVPDTGIAEMSVDQRAQAEALVQLAREHEPRIGGHRGSSELDPELRIEREPNRARCRITHRVVASASARSPRNPHFQRALSDYGLVRSPLKTEMRT